MLADLGHGLVRHDLGGGAWVDVQRSWVRESDALFVSLRDTVSWRAERRWMYDEVVEVPRLLAAFGAGTPLPAPLLDDARAALTDHYGALPGGELATAGLCFYRDGNDSVAWHGDRIGRGAHSDVIVAILSLGAPRDLCFRPRGGGATRLRLALGYGDLAVMGGTTQRTWDHAVPKTARRCGPRISVQFRPEGAL